MRTQILKKNSTKSERIFYEILKKNRVPFKFHSKIDDREVDFIIGKHIIEIDGHPQSSARNHWLIEKGYFPIHLKNEELKDREKINNLVKQIVKWH